MSSEDVTLREDLASNVSLHAMFWGTSGSKYLGVFKINTAHTVAALFDTLGVQKCHYGRPEGKAAPGLSGSHLEEFPDWP